jgi:3-oxoacyl-[acyl-carrier protein] reductase
MIETEGLHSAGIAGSDFQRQVESRTPLGRIGQPRDIATAVAFLASDDSGWLNGQAIEAAGGSRL